MTLFNNNNLKQFEFIKFISDNADDEHIMAKIVIRLRSDKLEAPYYMETRIRISCCADPQDKGVYHAMDIFNHRRMYNLTKGKYDEIENILNEIFNEKNINGYIQIKDDEKIKDITITSKSLEDLNEIFDQYQEFFDLIDDLI